MENKAWWLIAISIAAVAAIFFVDAIPQDHSYHGFADARAWLGIPNTLNVLSNLPFAMVALPALWLLYRQDSQGARMLAYMSAWRMLFVGVLLTTFGSSYYHLDPNNHTLVWDRLPMTLAFMGFFTLILCERINPRWAMALWPLVILGVSSVFYWAWTEHTGQGDLRPYALVQFLPMLLIPLILCLYPSKIGDTGYVIGLLLLYALAKLLEYWDQPILDLMGVVSGHSLKHLAAAGATASLYLMLLARIRSSTPSNPN